MPSREEDPSYRSHFKKNNKSAASIIIISGSL